MKPKTPQSPWLSAVERAVRAIPQGETASYAKVALMAGKPGAARAVVRALHSLSGIPWWRVIRSDGTLAPQVASEQGKKLAAEGVTLPRRKKRTSPP
jgi:methylated-DNA-protein-cysteine methyltransferase-like protein